MLKMMLWDYRDDNNCWDYVSYWLAEIYNVPVSDMPKFGLLPSQKNQLMAAEGSTKKNFIRCSFMDGAIACLYRKKFLYHVGLCHDGKIFHVRKSRTGVCVETKEKFKKHSEIAFYVHKSL